MKIEKIELRIQKIFDPTARGVRQRSICALTSNVKKALTRRSNLKSAALTYRIFYQPTKVF